MIYLIAIAVGLVAGAALGFGWGFIAADWYSRSFGAGDGGSAMGGFFTMGPIGFVVGFLLGSGFVLRGALPALSRGLLWGGGVVFAIGAVLFVMPWLMRQQERSRFAEFNLEMEFEVNATEPTERFRWGYQGHAAEGKADYPLITERIEGDKKVFVARMNMSDFPEKRLAWFAVSGVAQKFEVPVGGKVSAATEWSEWQPGQAVRFRWRMH
jgi:MFS family permease